MLALLLVLACWSRAPESPPSPVAARPVDPTPKIDPAPATGRGDACTADAECGWNDRCAPTRCGVAVPLAGICSEAWPPPGTCGCVEHQCTARLADPVRGTSPGCKTDADCGLDVGMGACVAGKPAMIGPITTTGPLCTCDAASACAPAWVDPIACTSWKDCDVVTTPRLHPVRANPPRTKPVKPCEDSEHDAICSPAGFCEVVSWSC